MSRWLLAWNKRVIEILTETGTYKFCHRHKKTSFKMYILKSSSYKFFSLSKTLNLKVSYELKTKGPIAVRSRQPSSDFPCFTPDTETLCLSSLFASTQARWWKTPDSHLKAAILWHMLAMVSWLPYLYVVSSVYDDVGSCITWHNAAQHRQCICTWSAAWWWLWELTPQSPFFRL